MKKLKNLALTAAVAVLASPISAFAADPTEGVQLLTDTQQSNLTMYVAGVGGAITAIMLAWLVVHFGIGGFKSLGKSAKG